MNTFTILVIIIVAVLILAAWLIPRIFDKSSDRIVKSVPELKEFLPEERGKIWLEAVCETLLHWKVIAGFTLLVGIVAGLTAMLSELIPQQWDKYLLYSLVLLIVLGARSFVIRRARATLASRNNISDDNRG